MESKNYENDRSEVKFKKNEHIKKQILGWTPLTSKELNTYSINNDKNKEQDLGLRISLRDRLNAISSNLVSNTIKMSDFGSRRSTTYEESLHLPKISFIKQSKIQCSDRSIHGISNIRDNSNRTFDISYKDESSRHGDRKFTYVDKQQSLFDFTRYENKENVVKNKITHKISGGSEALFSENIYGRSRCLTPQNRPLDCRFKHISISTKTKNEYMTIDLRSNSRNENMQTDEHTIAHQNKTSNDGKVERRNLMATIFKEIIKPTSKQELIDELELLNKEILTEPKASIKTQSRWRKSASLSKSSSSNASVSTMGRSSKSNKEVMEAKMAKIRELASAQPSAGPTIWLSHPDSKELSQAIIDHEMSKREVANQSTRSKLTNPEISNISHENVNERNSVNHEPSHSSVNEPTLPSSDIEVLLDTASQVNQERNTISINVDRSLSTMKSADNEDITVEDVSFMEPDNRPDEMFETLIPHKDEYIEPLVDAACEQLFFARQSRTGSTKDAFAACRDNLPDEFLMINGPETIERIKEYIPAFNNVNDSCTYDLSQFLHIDKMLIYDAVQWIMSAIYILDDENGPKNWLNDLFNERRNRLFKFWRGCTAPTSLIIVKTIVKDDMKKLGILSTETQQVVKRSRLHTWFLKNRKDPVDKLMYELIMKDDIVDRMIAAVNDQMLDYWFESLLDRIIDNEVEEITDGK